MAAATAATARATGSRPGIGYIHSAVDDRSRAAFCQILPRGDRGHRGPVGADPMNTGSVKRHWATSHTERQILHVGDMTSGPSLRIKEG
jgi:hypothetical protein